ncbi:MAG: 2Fe-2S iron-sulfur cluster binding domain-containing protein, partial [Pseudomonadota bacterium]|nr:2Fe-2S iron-sulfur cluster binding domain-containing protein [Pseudomonadota bacterium]
MNAPEHQVRIAGGDVVYTCAADDTVLRAAQRAGLAFPYECNVGFCANCRFELVDGEVQMQWPEAPGLTEKDRQKKRYLGCQSRPLTDCTIKLRLDPRYAPCHRPQRSRAVLEARRAITHDIAEFRFVLERPHTFEPGQYALAYLSGVGSGRAYSMSNIVSDGRVWEFQVRCVPGGKASQTLFERVHPGESIELDGPYGMAWLRRDAPRDILCLAGGSGLAPMISIARGAMAEPKLAHRHLHFIYGGRTPADICGEDMLQELPGWGERLSYHGSISETPPAASADSADGATPGWFGSVGYLHEVALQRFGAQLAQMEIYFAGPPAMAN